MPTFTPPTTTESSEDLLFGRYGIPVGQSVLFLDNSWQTVPYPWLGEVADLTEGETWFQGGRTYTISEETGDALAAAGYEVIA